VSRTILRKTARASGGMVLSSVVEQTIDDWSI
jgi:hypothetical protein